MTSDRTRPARAPRSTAGLAVLLLAVLLLVTACSGSGSDKRKLTPTQTLAAAKKHLDATSGVKIGLSTPKLPSGVKGVLAADGIGTHDPAFDGSIKVAVSGITANIPVVGVDGKVYAKLPFTSKYAVIDPSDYGAPDPAVLMSSDGGLSSLLTEATSVKKGKQVRSGKSVLTSYTADVPGKSVAAVIPSAAASATFHATFVIDDQDRVAKAVLTGPFYPKSSDVTYTITFDDYGTKQDIKAP